MPKFMIALLFLTFLVIFCQSDCFAEEKHKPTWLDSPEGKKEIKTLLVQNKWMKKDDRDLESTAFYIAKQYKKRGMGEFKGWLKADGAARWIVPEIKKYVLVLRANRQDSDLLAEIWRKIKRGKGRPSLGRLLKEYIEQDSIASKLIYEYGKARGSLGHKPKSEDFKSSAEFHKATIWNRNELKMCGILSVSEGWGSIRLEPIIIDGLKSKRSRVLIFATRACKTIKTDKIINLLVSRYANETTKMLRSSLLNGLDKVSSPLAIPELQKRLVSGNVSPFEKLRITAILKRIKDKAHKNSSTKTIPNTVGGENKTKDER